MLVLIAYFAAAFGYRIHVEEAVLTSKRRRIRRVRKENEEAYSVRSLNTLRIFSPSVPSLEVRAIKQRSELQAPQLRAHL